MSGYIGVAARTHVRMTGNGIAVVYKGDPVPPGADPDELKRLVDGGFLAKAADEDLGGLNSESTATVAEVLEAQGNAAAKAQDKADADAAKTDTPAAAKK